MSDEEADVLEGLYRLIAEDWRHLQALRKAVGETLDRLRSRIAQALTLGAGRRDLSRKTGVPDTTVRRLGGSTAPSSVKETADAA
jgi:hypothetical protein